jgi:predicted lysophospholipase L1 biosynthesis ABC-type transport system permease subunit
LIQASGVTASSGPYPVASATIRFDGRYAGVFAEGRDAASAAVDQPELTADGWVRSGGIVLERTFADALGVSVGDRVTLNDTSFTVAGIAVTAAQPPYPNLCHPSVLTFGNGYTVTPNSCSSLAIPGGNWRDIGVIWTTEADAIGLTSKANPLTMYALNLKLANPNDAQAFVDQEFERTVGSNGPGQYFVSWQQVGSTNALLINDERSVLKPGALLLALLAIASVAVLVGRRLSQYARRVGLLKAVGATPGFVATTFLAENLALALVATAAGLLAGWLAAPLLTNPGAALIPALFGLRLVARRPRRALLSAANIAVTVTGIVAVIAFHTAVNSKLSTAGALTAGGGLSDPVVNRDEQMLAVITIMLVALAALNALFATWATTLVVMAALTIVPARISSMRSIVGALQSEAA